MRSPLLRIPRSLDRLPIVASLLDQYSSLRLLRDRDLALLAGAAVVDFMSGSIVLPILPAYAADVGAGPLLIGVIFAAPAATRAVLSPVAGHLSDRGSRRRLIWTGTVLGAVSVVALAFVRSPVAFVALRGVDGAAQAMKRPATTAYVGDAAPEGQRGAAMGAFSSAGMVGLAVGPAVGGFLAVVGGYPAPFLVLGTATLLAGALLALSLRPVERADDAEAADDRGSASLATLDPRSIGSLLSVPVVALLASNLVSQVGTGAVGPLLAPLLALTVDAGPGYVGLAWSAFGLAMLLFVPVGGTLADRRGRKPFVVAGKLVWGLVAVGLALLTVPAVPPFLLFAGGVASGISGPALSALQYETAPEGYEGTALGLFSAAHAAGTAVGPIVGGLAGARYGLPAVFVGIGALWVLDTGTVAVGVRETMEPGSGDEG